MGAHGGRTSSCLPHHPRSPCVQPTVDGEGEKWQGSASFGELTTGRMVYGWIADEAVTGRGCLADCGAIVDPVDVGPPAFYVSHTWRGRVRVLFDMLDEFLAT
eukprot:355690-Chlamydomonas_euryale.AAC.1